MSECKKKFVKVVKYLNETDYYKTKFDDKMKEHFKLLHEKWRDWTETKPMQYYYDMKEHHTHINKKLEFDDKLETLWVNYISAVMNLRVNILAGVGSGRVGH